MSSPPNFDHLARLYRPMEHLTFGSLLEKTRAQFLPQLGSCRHALVFGDGDGRFLLRMLAQNSAIQAEVVDQSPRMVAELKRRCSAELPRLKLHCTNALDFTPSAAPDLVVTHFFLDCFTSTELGQFVPRIVTHMQPGALWLVSEFQIPHNGWSRFLGRMLVRSLYFIFRILTGLRVTSLPDYAGIFERSGLSRIRHHDWLFGILRSEIWQRQ